MDEGKLLIDPGGTRSRSPFAIVFTRLFKLFFAKEFPMSYEVQKTAGGNLVVNEKRVWERVEADGSDDGD